MSKHAVIWSAIVAVGAINFLARLSFIALFARREMPPLMLRALRHVGAAMLTAIVIPAVVFASAEPHVATLNQPKVYAALVAGLVAWKWRNMLATIVVGMAVLWLVTWLAR